MLFRFLLVIILACGLFKTESIKAATIPITISDTICLGSIYQFPDTSFVINTFTIHNYFASGQAGADDTLYTYEINLFLTYDNVISYSTCPLDSLLMPSGTYYYNIKNDTTMQQQFTSSQGCDSNYTLILTILPAYTIHYYDTICYKASYTFADSNFVDYIIADTNYVSNFFSANFCDSNIIQHIYVRPEIKSDIYDSVCKWSNYVAPDGNTIFEITKDTIYAAVFPKANACDSTVYLHIKAKVIDTSVTANWQYLSAVPQIGATYQWVNCVTDTAIIGATSPNFQANQNGLFRVVISNNGCKDSSSCYSVFNVGLLDNNQYQVSFYPNPTADYIFLKDHNKMEGISIYDATGTLIKQLRSNEIEEKINLAALPPGIYFLKLQTAKSIDFMQLHKQ